MDTQGLQISRASLWPCRIHCCSSTWTQQPLDTVRGCFSLSHSDVLWQPFPHNIYQHSQNWASSIERRCDGYLILASVSWVTFGNFWNPSESPGLLLEIHPLRPASLFGCKHSANREQVWKRQVHHLADTKQAVY